MVEQISPEDIALVEQQGYELGQIIGEGHTNVVYSAIYSPLNQHRAVKFPKRFIDPSSITTRINQSKQKDRNLHEALTQGSISHPNIARLYDVISVTEGRHAIIEEYDGHVSLEALVRSQGPLKGRYLEVAVNGIGEALEELFRRGLVHRDIKPQNIIVKIAPDKEMQEIKLTDMQNAEKIRDITDSPLPTRGATSYAHPAIINTILGTQAHASVSTELYTAAATLYFAITGKQPFDYSLKQDPLSKLEIDIAGEKERVSLFSNSSQIESITKELHTSNLEKALARLPRQYRGFFAKALSYEGSYDDLIEFRKSLHSALGYKTRLRSRILKTAAGLTMAAGIVLGTLYGVQYGKEAAERKALQEIGKRHTVTSYAYSFNMAFDTLKADVLGLKNGKDPEKKEFNRLRIHDTIIDEVASQYPNISGDLLRRVMKANACYGNQYGTVEQEEAYSLFLLDPLQIGTLDKEYEDPIINLEEGAQRLSQCMTAAKGNEKEALIRYYSPHLSGVRYSSSIDDYAKPLIEAEARKLAYNISIGGHEIYDGPRFTAIVDSPKGF